ncbi:HDOD domain-containing protein [Alishewanella sp. SMS8]|uniref:HDOD domain-containing protein n=1 Tax=Alishewanella sp. SMS8 TaxID=2994676 RepID=UPI0027414024|nr:HDOD domain-containing protein [Alishewanella sp. SMS8]MDP4946008.1 HDOD domain-containing protein [Alishewanella sp.]MDP5035363.1 HDOD domain-containing protein [Alishewanella sp.]MDP5188183.1 HDOD domain-containing protein [Alishewanella sp.]MDP5458018.1 HDOD domain-containing protein [Alishewanella sp. SMS8]
MAFNVLFIDDDIFMLRALQRTAVRLRPDDNFIMCNQETAWQNTLSAGMVPDAVFCDYLMPLKNGDKVLKEIEHIHPSAVRILLTGNTTEDVISSVSNVAHFVLSKPFVDDDLNYVFSCLERLNALMLSPKIRNEVGRHSYFFSLPETTVKIQRLFSQPEMNITEAANLIEQDSVVTAKIIQLANSAFLGYRRHTTSLTEALKRLGLRLAEAIVVSISIEQRMLGTVSAQVHKRCSDWAYRYATACRQNSKLLGFNTEMQDLISVAALLTGLGHFVVAADYPDYTPDSHQAPINFDVGLSADPVTLRAVFLLTLWGFSFDLCEIISQQDTPDLVAADGDEPMLNLVMFVSKLALNKKVNSESLLMLKSRIKSKAVIDWLDKVLAD